MIRFTDCDCVQCIIASHETHNALQRHMLCCSTEEFNSSLNNSELFVHAVFGCFIIYQIASAVYVKSLPSHMGPYGRAS